MITLKNHKLLTIRSPPLSSIIAVSYTHLDVYKRQALILSLSNGVNQYIQSIEEETLSEYPLQIQSTGFDITSMMTDVHPGPGTEEKDESKIYVSQMITNMFSKIGSNDLTSLKEYLDSGKSDIKKNTNSIEYNYNVAPQIYSPNTKNIRQVHPDKSFAALG